jgi:hypothetical protein
MVQGPEEGSVQVDIHEKRQASAKGQSNKPAETQETAEPVRFTPLYHRHVPQSSGERSCNCDVLCLFVF